MVGMERFLSALLHPLSIRKGPSVTVPSTTVVHRAFVEVFSTGREIYWKEISLSHPPTSHLPSPPTPMPHSTSKPTVISLHIVKDAALAALSSAVQLAIDLLFLVTLTALFITLPVLFSPMSIEGSESHDHDTPIREFQPLVEEASMEWGEASAGATRQLLPESPPLVAHPSSPPAFNLLGHIREERDDVEPAGGSKGDGEEMEKDDVDYLELPRLLCISRNPREPEQLSTGLEDEGDNVRDEGRGEGALEEQGSATDGEYALGGQGSATDGQVAFEEEGWATNGEDIVRELAILESGEEGGLRGGG